MSPDISGLLSFQVLLFLLFGTGALAAAVAMVLFPNPIRSALMLVLNLFCVAVMYLLLNASFLAAVQVIVYTGAIMVLFLFVIMLLNLGSPERTPDRIKWQQPVAIVVGLVAAGVLSLVIFSSVPAVPVVRERDLSNSPMMMQAPTLTAPGDPGGAGVVGGAARGPAATGPVVVAVVDPESEIDYSDPEHMGTVAGVGLTLYNPALPWLFPFELTSVLLLIAVIGSVVLAKRRLPGEPETFNEQISEAAPASSVTPGETTASKGESA
ncbi:MAG: hypothetical protein OHK0029_11290 [Armatimonadaceae bacterium]